jgi:hypothetical protein
VLLFIAANEEKFVSFRCNGKINIKNSTSGPDRNQNIQKISSTFSFCSNIKYLPQYFPANLSFMFSLENAINGPKYTLSVSLSNPKLVYLTKTLLASKTTVITIDSSDQNERLNLFGAI